MEPGDAVNTVMGNALEALRIVAILANPALPTTTQEIWSRIGLAGKITDLRIGKDTQWGQYTGGTTVVKGQPLFPRLSA
jgi:methionyl-tRNA synthetase